jgi:hypothetical protein
VQQAIVSLLTFAESQEEVASRVLEPAAGIVGARAIAIRNNEGVVVAAWNVPDDAWASLERGQALPTLWDDARVVELEVADGSSMVVWTSPYAPVFGDEELRVLKTLGASSVSPRPAGSSKWSGITDLARARQRCEDELHRAPLMSSARR